MSNTPQPAKAPTAVSATPPKPAAAVRPRKGRKPLAPSQKYEIFTSVLTSSATQRELAEKYGIDRTTIRSICATAKQGALDALTSAVPGRRGKTVEQVELETARAEIERLKATVCEQAMSFVLRQGSCRISGFESDHTVGVWLIRE